MKRMIKSIEICYKESDRLFKMLNLDLKGIKNIRFREKNLKFDLKSECKS